MDLEKLAFEIGLLLVGAISTWGAMKSQVSDLRKSAKEQSDRADENFRRSDENLRRINILEGYVPKIKEVDVLALKVNTLEAQHANQSEQLVTALRKLEEVTQKLQEIALELARTAK